MPIFRIAAFLAALGASGIALADGDSIKDGAKKTEQGFGRLLQGMGQELKKAGAAVGKAAKGEAKKEPKRGEKRESDERR